MFPPINQNPGRTLIVADPGKLTYFARANAVRAGTVSTWGALQGLGVLPSDSYLTNTTASADTTQAAGSFQTIGNLLGQLGRGLLGSGTPPPVYRPPPPDNTALHIGVGLAVAAVVGVVVWKVAKKAM